VVDSYGAPDSPSATWILDVRRSDPAPFVLTPRHVVSGESTTLELTSLVGPFDPGEDVALHLGDDVTVESVDILDGHSGVAQVVVDVRDGVEHGWVSAQATIGGQPHAVDRALEIRGRLETLSSCQAAVSATPVEPGVYAGDTQGGAPNEVSPERCLGETADGTETIFPVVLGPSESLRASARMPDRDLVLYVVPGCSSAVLHCADDRYSDGWEYLHWAASPEGETVYLVVDGYEAEDVGPFDLHLEVSL